MQLQFWRDWVSERNTIKSDIFEHTVNTLTRKGPVLNIPGITTIHLNEKMKTDFCFFFTGFSVSHIMVLILCIFASGSALLLCFIIYCRQYNEGLSCLQMSKTFFIYPIWFVSFLTDGVFCSSFASSGFAGVLSKYDFVFCFHPLGFC